MNIGTAAKRVFAESILCKLLIKRHSMYLFCSEKPFQWALQLIRYVNAHVKWHFASETKTFNDFRMEHDVR